MFPLVLVLLFKSSCGLMISMKPLLGEDTSLRCGFANNSFPSGGGRTAWFKNGLPLKDVQLNQKKIEYHKSRQILKIKKLAYDDSGVYACRNRSSGNGMSSFITYNISVTKPTHGLKFRNVQRILDQRNTVKPAGSDVIFDCQAIGEGPIQYKWYKGGEPLLSRRTDSNLQMNRPELKLKNLRGLDSANYTCVAQNRYKNITANMVLYVQGVLASPWVEKATMKNQTKYVGDNVSIVCYELITGTIPDFRWIKWTGPVNEILLSDYLRQESGVGALDDKVAKVIHGKFYRPIKKDATWTNGNGRSVVRGVECLLTNVTVEDSGFYTCIATNHIGEDYASMYLEVKKRVEKPAITFNRPGDNGQHLQIIIAALGVLVLVGTILIIWLFVKLKFRGRSGTRLNDATTPAVSDVLVPHNPDSDPLSSSSERRTSDPDYTIVDPEIRTGMYVVLDDIPILMKDKDAPAEI